MNNNFKKAICIIGALATIASMNGCSSKVSKESQTTTAKDSGVLNYEELPKENGTAAYTYKYKDTSGQEQTDKVEIDIDEVDNISFVDTGDISSERFVSDIAQKGYGMTEKEAEEIASNQADYQEFQFVEYIQNNSNKVLAYKALKVTDNGKDGVWIKTSLDAEYTIAPGVVQAIYLFGIVDTEKYSEEEAEEIFDSMKIQIEYTLVNSAQEDIDWETADVKTMDIH